MTHRSRNIIVGAVVLAAMLALGWMILQFSGKTASNLLSNGMPFQLTGERADGVSEGSPIYFRGVPVGRVERVQLRPDNSGVQINAVLDAGKSVPENVIGYVRPSS